MARIRILVFDMEFANGKIPGSVYSFGYLVMNERFDILTPPTDIVINPDCEWNEYVATNILAYPRALVESAPTFDAVYGTLFSLLEEVDFAVGFSISNDIRALRAACVRCALKIPDFAWLDVERVCKRVGLHREAHGLEGCFRAWCPLESVPEKRHRSDVDAYMTARLLEGIGRQFRVSADMLKAAYPECCGKASDWDAPKIKKKERRKRRPVLRKKQKHKKEGSTL